MAIATPYQELDAVNLILRKSGSRPVNIIGSGVGPALIAQNTLRSVSRSIQSDGLFCNTEFNVPLSADGSGDIYVPTTALKVVPVSLTRGLCQRGDRIYDSKNRTFNLTSISPVKFNITYCLDYDDLPEPTKTYIAVRAAREYIQEQLGGIEIAGFTEREEREAESKHLRYDDTFKGASLFNKNLSMIYVNNRNVVPRNF